MYTVQVEPTRFRGIAFPFFRVSVSFYILALRKGEVITPKHIGSTCIYLSTVKNCKNHPETSFWITGASLQSPEGIWQSRFTYLILYSCRLHCTARPGPAASPFLALLV